MASPASIHLKNTHMKESGPVVDDIAKAKSTDYSKLGTATSKELVALSDDELRLNNMLQLQLAQSLSSDWFEWLTNPENSRMFRTAFNAVRDEWLNSEPEKWYEMVQECARLEERETEVFSEIQNEILERMKEEA
jgi:hypothetical protein